VIEPVADVAAEVKEVNEEKAAEVCSAALLQRVQS
jgi:hypothetical protein